MNGQPGETEDKELLPLLVLAPRGPGSSEPLAQSQSGERSTMLYRSEFGYDVRMDGERPQQHYQPTTERKNKSWFGIVAGAALLMAAALVILQPGARGAVADFFVGHHPAAAAPAPTPTSQVLGVSTQNGNPGPSTPTPKVQPVELIGSYAVAPDGTSTTTCNQGTAAASKCSWTINHRAGDPLHLRLSWTGTAQYSFNVVDSVGDEYFSGTSSTSPMAAAIPNSSQTLTFTVTINGAQSTNFTIDVNES